MLPRIHMTCNTHTPSHPSTAEEVWYWLKHVLCIGCMTGSTYIGLNVVLSTGRCGSLILSPTGEVYSPLVVRELSAGDGVRVELDPELFKVAQEDHGGWEDFMAEVYMYTLIYVCTSILALHICIASVPGLPRYAFTCAFYCPRANGTEAISACVCRTHVHTQVLVTCSMLRLQCTYMYMYFLQGLIQRM